MADNGRKGILSGGTELKSPMNLPGGQYDDDLVQQLLEALEEGKRYLPPYANTLSRISRMDEIADPGVVKGLGGTGHLDDADDILSAAKRLDGTGGEVKAGTDAMVEASTGFKEGSSFTDIVNNPQNVNIHGNINSELDEGDMINKIIYEDKNASKLYMEEDRNGY